MTVTIATTSPLQTLRKLFPKCEIIDSPEIFVETAFRFVGKVLKATTYMLVTVTKMHQLSFICLQVKTTHGNSKKLAATWFVPLVLNIDLESFLRPVSACKVTSDKSFTLVRGVHERCGFALTVLDHHSSKPIFHHSDSSPSCMTNFVKILYKLARDIYQQKKITLCSKAIDEIWEKIIATHCWIFEKPFSEAKDPENTVDLDYCNCSGKFLLWAQEKCNCSRLNINLNPLVGQDIQNYDLNHICLARHNCEPTTIISVIPSTDEKTYQWLLVC